MMRDAVMIGLLCGLLHLAGILIGFWLGKSSCRVFLEHPKQPDVDPTLFAQPKKRRTMWDLPDPANNTDKASST